MDIRSRKDRRSWRVRREDIYNLDYFLNGGTEKRSGFDRRKRDEDRRRGWVSWAQIKKMFRR